MRLLILKDQDITTEELDELQRQFTDLMYEHTSITPTYYVEEKDFSAVPLETDADGDTKPSYAYRKSLTDDIYKRYKEFGVDHIIMLVHRDNWTFKGIWGVNWSNLFHSYHFSLCRFDSKNVANSLGTVYHEVHHSFDALIATTLNININPILKVSNYDAEITHGKGQGWEYIRYKENTKSLETMSGYLRASYDKRQELHDEQVKGLQRSVISLLQQFILLYRAVYNQKDGYPKK